MGKKIITFLQLNFFFTCKLIKMIRLFLYIVGGVSREDYEGGRRYDNRGGRGGERHRLVFNHLLTLSLLVATFVIC